MSCVCRRETVLHFSVNHTQTNALFCSQCISAINALDALRQCTLQINILLSNLRGAPAFPTPAFPTLAIETIGLGLGIGLGIAGVGIAGVGITGVGIAVCTRHAHL